MRTQKETELVMRTPPVPDSGIFPSRHGAHCNIVKCSYIVPYLLGGFPPLSCKN